MYNYNMNNQKDSNNYLVYGVFDTFHSGHVNLLYRASLKGKVYVAVFSDDEVEISKGKKPFYPEELRVSIVESLDFVEKVILIGPGKHGEIWDFAKENNVKFGLLGDDHNHERAKNWFKNNGVTLEITPRTNGVSSTIIKEILLNK